MVYLHEYAQGVPFKQAAWHKEAGLSTGFAAGSKSLDDE